MPDRGVTRGENASGQAGVSGGTHIRLDGEGAGNGPPLVLIHGVGLDHTMWDLVVGDLATDRLVVHYDLLGHGQSVDPPGPRTVENLVDQCLGVLDTCGPVTPDVAGLSLGGMVALGLAVRHPGRLGRLALCNTVFDRSAEDVQRIRERLSLAEAGRMGSVVDLAVDRWFDAGWQATHPDRVDAVRNRLLSNNLEAYLKAYRAFVEGDPLKPGEACSVPTHTLAVTGELDPGSTPAMTSALAVALEDCRAVILPGLHHIPPIEDPTAFVAVLRSFLEKPYTSDRSEFAGEATR